MTETPDPAKWAEEQPPAWQGPPLDAEPPAAPRPQPSPKAPAAVPTPTARPNLVRETLRVFRAHRFEFFRAAARNLPWLVLILVPATLLADYLLDLTGLDLDKGVAALTPTASATLTTWLFFSAVVSTLAQTWLTVRCARIALSHKSDLPPMGTSWKAYTSAQAVFLVIMAVTAAPGLLTMTLVDESPRGLIAALATLVLVPAWAGFTLWLATGTLPLVGVAAAEGIGGLAALKRSLSIAKGTRLRLVGPYLVVSLLAGLIANLIASVFIGYELPVWWQNSLLAGLASAIALAVSVPFQAIVMALGYEDVKN